jgi:hypothetical protein
VENEIGGYGERGTRLGWEGEEAGFKAGIESDDKVSDASVRWMGSFWPIVRVRVGWTNRPDQASPHLYITFGPLEFIFSPSSPFPLHVSFLSPYVLD